ncbi:Uu.00g072490.m01.CDS01 [Anthostomella pinea]|uniref:Uu.00g072490.m01.CDS01 n=1 Tax=Anthostomella pinea TaxID=933095 RepID=A0AAI8VVV9_9PEZI|nr:Uu.00g072490.m01.CDS01 [Anthostomella pinea]
MAVVFPTLRRQAESTSANREDQPQAAHGIGTLRNVFNSALGLLGQREAWTSPKTVTPDLTPFEYDSLPTSGRQESSGFYVLKILMSPSCAPEYTALSYTWGEVSDYPIVLNGKLAQVRSNLLAFLLRVWQDADAKNKMYWIDAVCIYQQNIPERNEFVSRMTEIYEKAYSIVVWLGPGSAEEVASSFDALDTLTGLAVFEGPGGTRYKAKNTSYKTKDGIHVNSLPDSSVLKERLLANPYWQRVWILQEASTPKLTGPGTTSVWYGDRTRNFGEFIISMSTLTGKYRGSKEKFGIHLSPPLERLGLLWMQREKARAYLYPPANMMSLLQHARASRCTADRDRIYALLPAAIDFAGYRADYSKQISEVYSDLASHLITQESNLDVLGFTDGRRNINGLPSWVADWTHPDVPAACPKSRWEQQQVSEQQRKQLDNKFSQVPREDHQPPPSEAIWEKSNIYNASAGLQSPSSGFVTADDPSALRLRGFTLDHIVSVDSASIFMNHRSWKPYEHANCKKFDALMTTASAGVYSEPFEMHARLDIQFPQPQEDPVDTRSQMMMRFLLYRSLRIS